MNTKQKKQLKARLKTAKNLDRLADHLEMTRPKICMGRLGVRTDQIRINDEGRVVALWIGPGCPLGHALFLFKIKPKHFQPGWGFDLRNFIRDHFPALDHRQPGNQLEAVFGGRLSSDLEEAVARLRIMALWLRTTPDAFSGVFRLFRSRLVTSGLIKDCWPPAPELEL